MKKRRKIFHGIRIKCLHTKTFETIIIFKTYHYMLRYLYIIEYGKEKYSKILFFFILKPKYLIKNKF